MVVDGTVESHERQERLLAALVLHGSIRIRNAAVELGVSEMTIRRDLDELERTNDIRRVRGGATIPGLRPFSGRDAQNSRAKAQIAEKLIRLVPSHGNIALDSSSTIMRLVPQLSATTEQFVVTNGLKAAEELTARQVGRPVLTGGEPNNEEGLLLGPLACATARSLTYARYFFSANGVHPQIGVTDLSIEGAEIKRAFASVSGELILAADSSKLGVVSTAVSFEMSRIDYLVTELDPGDPLLAEFAGITQLV